MYETYYGLSERPFSIAPDPQYLYMSQRHKEAMAHLAYGVQQGGCFIVFTGEVGTGKTTLCRNLLDDLPSNVDIALVLNATLDEIELLQTICDELKVDYEGTASQKQLLDAISAHLLDAFAANRHTVLIIDEAQLLSRNALEQIRLLTNLETNKQKLLQIILIGQPELNDVLLREDLRQLAQRVTAKYHLGALPAAEVEDYVSFRLSVAGRGQALFSRQALKAIYKLTDGIPRRINVLADQALLSAYSKSKSLVDAATVKLAAKEVFIAPHNTWSRHLANSKSFAPVAAAAGLICVLGLAYWLAPKMGESATGSIANQQSEQNTVVANNQNENQRLSQNLSQSDALVVESDRVSIAAQNLDANDLSDSQLAAEQKPPSPSEVSLTDGLEPSALNPSVLQDSAQKSEEVKPQARIASASDVAKQPDLQKGAGLKKETSAMARYDGAAQKTFLNGAQFSQKLRMSSDKTGRIAALRQLAALWQETLPLQMFKTVCDEVAQLDMGCIGVSSWEQIVRYNRPLVMVLQDQQSEYQSEYRVLLKSLADGKAEILVGGEPFVVETNELIERWDSRALAFWKPPEIGQNLYKLGDRSSNIVWLRLQLNQALKKVGLAQLKQTASTEFDGDFSQKLFALQSRFDLNADSVVGVETYLLLDDLLNSSSPRLFSRLQDKP